LKNSHNSLEYIIKQKTNIGHDKNYYGYIPIDPHTLFRLLKEEISKIEDIGSKKFLDAGAGNSTICNIMSIMGFGECQGLEYRKIYVELNPLVLFRGNILTYNFKKWDVIYSYNPIIDKKMMAKGIDRIVSTMKPGAVFYFVGASNYPIETLISHGGVRINVSYNIIKYVKPFSK
jgi:hypothetical protein